LLRDDDLAQRIEDDFESAGLSDKRLAMLRYALKLTTSSKSVDKSDVEKMRQVGFSDTDILHIAEVTGYYAYANRIADGLGIPLEDWIPEPND
jgi:uncharacterized peroxidase-related enzyme